MLNRGWLTIALVSLVLSGAAACGNTNYNCVATCNGSPFAGYTGGTISAGSVQDAVNMCVSALQSYGCVTPKQPACACN